MLSLPERQKFHDAPIMMDFRRETVQNPENNATYYNRKKLYRHGLKHKIPVARFEAQHQGAEQDVALKMDDADFVNLPSVLELAIDVPVIVILNLVIGLGIMNGTRGIVKDILFEKPDGPLSRDQVDRMPHTVLVDCPKYTGPSFFNEHEYPEKRTWVPFRPQTRTSERDGNVQRIQFPFVLGWAITVEKAQGMTIEKGGVRMGAKAGEPGKLFTALTRFPHPDCFMLDDSFPDMRTIMQQRHSLSFSKRQEWEKHMRILFSRTLRRHLRDSTLYNPDMVWTDDETKLAEDIFACTAAHPDCSEEDIYDSLRRAHEDLHRSVFSTVWARLQKWPHICELEASRSKTARRLKPAPQPAEGDEHMPRSQAPISRVVANGYYVSMTEWLAFCEHGTLTLDSFDFIAKVFRPS